MLLRAKYLVDVVGYNHVRGLPLKAAELAEAITDLISTTTTGRGRPRPTPATDSSDKGGRQVTTRPPSCPSPGSRASRPPRARQLTGKDYTSDQEVRWCPGCGDYAVLKAVQGFLPDLGLRRENIVFVSGIGCSSRFPYYLDTYGMHSIHGRAPAIATGIATAREDLSVWVVTGDGDALSIGGNHLIHAMRRNVNLKILLFNNRIYGLTKGQYSPTSEPGKVTKSTPAGSVDHPFNPVSLALGAEATFVARTVDSDRKHLTSVLSAAAAHRGTALVEIYQNCPIFNDGAFDAIKQPDTKADAIIPLVQGEPIRFGVGAAAKGIVRVRRPAGSRSSQVADVDEADLLVHDAHDRRPVDGVRAVPAHRRGRAAPVADRHLPPGRAADVRRPGARPDRHGLGRPGRPASGAGQPDQRRRHLDGRLRSVHAGRARGSSATALRRARPFSKSGPIILSMFMNLPKTAIIPFCSPVITQAPGCRSRWARRTASLSLVALNGLRKWTVMSTALGRRAGDLHAPAARLAVARPVVGEPTPCVGPAVGAVQLRVEVLPRRPLGPWRKSSTSACDAVRGAFDGDAAFARSSSPMRHPGETGHPRDAGASRQYV